MKIFPLHQSLLGDLRAELNALRDDVREMALARWELAQLEIETDLRSAKRLALVWAAAALMVLTSLPLVFVLLADVLAGCCGIPHFGWLLIFIAGLLGAAVVGSLLAWRRFRRRFVGLEETLEELREDLLWLKEKAKRKGESAGG
jgi:hypothetical protein